MNTERLHRLARELHAEITKTKLVNTMTKLHQQLQEAINTPNENTQRQVEATLNSLLEELEGVPSNQLSPGMRANVTDLLLSDERSADKLVGRGLAEELRTIFRPGYTSVQTLDQLKTLLDELNRLASSLQQILTSFSAMRVPDETLEPGTSVIGMVIPRDASDCSLRELQSELKFLGQFLVELTEVIDGSATEHQVFSLYASDLGIDVLATLSVAADFATIVTALQYAFDRIAGFRDLKAKAEELGVDKETTERLSAQGQQVMQDKLTEVHANIIQKSKVSDSGRARELETAIEFRLNGLANRLDRGFRFEVRTQLPADATGEQTTQAEHIANLTTVSFKPIDGPRLLALPESAGQSDANGETGRESKAIVKSRHRGKASDQPKDGGESG